MLHLCCRVGLRKTTVKFQEALHSVRSQAGHRRFPTNGPRSISLGWGRESQTQRSTDIGAAIAGSLLEVDLPTRCPRAKVARLKARFVAVMQVNVPARLAAAGLRKGLEVCGWLTQLIPAARRLASLGRVGQQFD